MSRQPGGMVQNRGVDGRNRQRTTVHGSSAAASAPKISVVVDAGRASLEGRPATWEAEG